MFGEGAKYIRYLYCLRNVIIFQIVLFFVEKLSYFSVKVKWKLTGNDSQI